MIGEPPDATKCMPMTLYHYVTDCDAVWKQAVAAGGEVVHEPMDMFYGDRTGAVKDPGGNMWWIATHKEELSVGADRGTGASFYKQHTITRVSGASLLVCQLIVFQGLDQEEIRSWISSMRFGLR